MWIGAAEAAGLLGVTRATLYAYVSRGYVRSQARSGSSRERGYSRDDIERVRRRTEERRDPDKAAARALQWGVPVLESAITLIDAGALYYRGHDAAALARFRSVEEVASLIDASARRRQRSRRQSPPPEAFRPICGSSLGRSLCSPPRHRETRWLSSGGRKAWRSVGGAFSIS